MTRFALSALVAGLIGIAVGSLFRFGPRVERSSAWWPGAMLIAVIFGYAPRSWLPWGAAAILLGLGGLIGGEVAGALNLAAIVLLAFGILLVFWHISWMEPRSLLGLERPSRPQA